MGACARSLRRSVSTSTDRPTLDRPTHRPTDREQAPRVNFLWIKQQGTRATEQTKAGRDRTHDRARLTERSRQTKRFLEGPLELGGAAEVAGSDRGAAGDRSALALALAPLSTSLRYRRSRCRRRSLFRPCCTRLCRCRVSCTLRGQRGGRVAPTSTIAADRGCWPAHARAQASRPVGPSAFVYSRVHLLSDARSVVAACPCE